MVSIITASVRLLLDSLRLALIYISDDDGMTIMPLTWQQGERMKKTEGWSSELIRNSDVLNSSKGIRAGVRDDLKPSVDVMVFTVWNHGIRAKDFLITSHTVIFSAVTTEN